MRNYLLQTFFSIFFQCVLFICAKYYHYLIKLLNDDVQGQKGHSMRNNRNFVIKYLIDEAQESTNYIMEEEIHAPCGSESVNVTLYQM